MAFVVTVKSTVKISSIFVAFLENMNFTVSPYKKLSLYIHIPNIYLGFEFEFEFVS